MPDLRRDSVHAFWDSYDRRTLYRVIVAIEYVEQWALDEDKEIDQALINLGDAIDNKELNIAGKEAAVIRILASVKCARAMRLLQAMDVAKPGTASSLLMKAEELAQDMGSRVADPYAKMFLKRNMVFERLQLLTRVFAPQRISLVLKALEKYSD